MPVLELIPEVYMPLFIFFARILDVSMGTLRIMFVSKGMRLRASMLGFLEILIWIIIIAQIFQNLTNWMNYVAFAGGFAVGTYLGMFIEEKMKMGIQIFRIISNQDVTDLLSSLKDAGFRVTAINAEGSNGPVRILFTVTRRKHVKQLAELVNRDAPKSFYSVEDVKYVSTMEDESTSESDIFTKLLKLRKSM